MTTIQEEELREYFYAMPEGDVLERVKALGRSKGDLLSRREELKLNPVDRMIKELNIQLAETVAKYGRVDMATLPNEKLLMVFARIQGEESRIRSEILFLESTKKTVDEITKSLEIARSVLAEKRKAEGRRQ